MNGAKADPSVKIIKNPNSNRNTTIGVSHHFFRAFKKAHSSLTIATLLMSHLHIILYWN